MNIQPNFIVYFTEMFHLPKEIIDNIYEYDNTYHIEYKNFVSYFKKMFKFVKYITTLKNNIVYIYKTKDNSLCASSLSPLLFYDKLRKHKIYLYNAGKYSKNFETYNKQLKIKLWFNDYNYNFILNKIFSKH